MTYFCYFSRSGHFRAIENPGAEFDPDQLWDLAFAFGTLEGKDVSDVERQAKLLLQGRWAKFCLK